MGLDAVARAPAYSAALSVAKLAQKLAKRGVLTTEDVEELRVIAMQPFDQIQIGNPALPPPETTMLQRMRDLLDVQWDDACRLSRDPD